MGKRTIDAGLLNYCKTEKQRNYVATWLEAGSASEASRLLGIRRQTISRSVGLLIKARELGRYDPATRSRIKDESASISKEPLKKLTKLSKQRKALYVITCAQNATPIFREGFDAIINFCGHNNANLIVIPLRYKNPTSQWTSNNEGHDWWAEELAPYLVERRVELNKNLVLMADIKTQPTAVRPTSGMETFCGGQSTIIGHPKLEVLTVPTPQHRLAKIIHTTGAITVDNYTDSKAGKKGEHHHTFGALVVKVEGDRFFIRQINIDEDGSFYDLDSRYTASEVTTGHRAAALVMGDTHVRFVDPGVVKATFTAKDSMNNVLNPEILVFHDVLDFHSQNHHHRDKVFTKVAKHKFKKSCVEDEVDECAAFVDSVMRDDQRGVFAASNHPDALARWVESSDWKHDPENCVFYLKTALVMAESALMTKHGASRIDPFVYWMQQKLKRVQQCHFPSRDEPVMIADVDCGMHGDQGPNGSRGNIKSFGKIGVKSVIGHTHAPGVMDGVYQVGTSSLLRLEYNSGPSSWMHCHCVIYPNGKRSLLFIIEGKW